MNNKGLTKTIFAVGLIAAIVLSTLLSYGFTATQLAVGTKSLKGDTGMQGLKGDTGDTGASGAMGATGPAGPTGATGATGASGTQGLQGIQGPAGLSNPDYDSGWIAIKAGQYTPVNHNLNSADIIVQITGKTTIDGQAHQKYYGLTGFIPGWNLTIGGTKEDQAFAVAKTTDGGYIVGAETKSFGAGGWDIMLFKLDANGNQQWNKTYGGLGTDYVNYVIQTIDGGYLTCGPTNSYGNGGYDIMLLKTDVLGNAQWNKTFGTMQDEYSYGVTQTTDGGYIAVGTNSSTFFVNGTGAVDVFLVKTDALGNLQWNKPYVTTAGYGMGFNVLQTSDGYVFSSAGFYGSGDHDFGITKVDSQGNVVWFKNFGGNLTDICRSLVATSDGGYALAGLTNSFGNGQHDVWLVKLNGTGTMVWNKTYGGIGDDNLFAYSGLIQTSDGGFAMSAATTSYGAGARDFWLIKTDSYGNVQYDKTYGAMGAETPYSITQAADGSLVIAGFTNSFGAGNYDIYLVKNSVEGESGLAWVDSTTNSVRLYRGANDIYWNYVRVEVWKIK